MVIIASAMAALFVVATPIGNLEDITLRALRILKEVKIIAAEDTRKTRRLLTAYNIKTPTTSYHEHNKISKLDYILSRLEKDDVALVSDAGTPGISDPGYELISAVARQNIKIIPVPGPSALTSALIASGLPTDNFCFLGFLPHRSLDRRKVLKDRTSEKSTLVLFESPHRLITSLKDMLEIWGDRRAAFCRELTKIHEEIFRCSLSQAVEHFVNPRGEFTIVVAGRTESSKPVLDGNIEKQLFELRKSGVPSKIAIQQITEQTGISHRDLYKVWIKYK